ncbi:type II secretion system F family protein [Candidatus Micrarchaeota archaeon]|nr:type II secretion system F family protein [Candidatus Micrarchaeota archaeon]
MKSVLFLPFPERVSKRLMHLFYFLGKPLSKAFPSLSTELAQLESEYDDWEFTSIGLLAFFFYFIVFGFFFGVVLLVLDKLSFEAGIVGVLTSFLAALSIFGLILLYPKLLLERKNNELEADLLFALRQLYIQSSAGVPLFNSLTSLTKGFGSVSKEFEIVIKDVQGGMSFADSLEKSALKNPSIHYRRVIWQLSNAVKAGVELTSVLNSVVSNLTEEQKIAFKKFGSQLSPLALMYLLLTIIGPTLGLVFLIVLVSFVPISLNEFVLALILFFMILIQFFFIGLISSRRPSVLI